MKRAFRLGFHICILLAFGAFVGCSDEDPAAVPAPEPDPAVAGSMGIYADAAGTNSRIVDDGGTVTVYVVHKIEVGGIASAFTVEAPAGWTRLGAASQYPVNIGDVDAGMSIGYGNCLTGTIHLMTLTYDSPGNSAAGSTFKILPHPEWPDNIRVVDCDAEMLTDCVGRISSVVVQ